ncbi:LysR family transcriptional regulator [Herminiimonas sp. KBW02]|uniref:LysR family transcriptional regulator n=1 Tax=Herminiimonas sp. KBW02 TaxID=2153363 RepID=UPI000F5B560D|nr:LysR family transcriptional regulator [Herminiimonas sp. KBW02]RQO36411.1 LysR family transcriptional regulator [Herminiimonas sp. KBW02]
MHEKVYSIFGTVGFSHFLWTVRAMMDIKLIESFVLLMRHGSLGRAENVGGIPKTTISRQIAKLEEILGVQLFLRSTRRIAPTEAGTAFYAHCEQILAELNAGIATAQTDVQNLSAGLRGDLYMLTNSHLGTSFVSRVLGLYLDSYPNVTCHLDLVGEDIASIPDNVDCYVCSRPPNQPNLVAKLLGYLTYRLYASPDYLRRHGTPTRPEDLEHHPRIILTTAPHGGRWHLHKQGASCDSQPRTIVTTNDYWITKTFAIDGYGIVLLPDFFTRPEIDAGILSAVLPDWHADKVPVYCVYQQQRYMGRKLRALVDLMAESFILIESFQKYVGHAIHKRREQ